MTDLNDPRIDPERLRSRRLTLGLTQEALAERCGVNQSTISQLERGEQVPTVRSLVALATALGTSMEWLLGIDDADAQQVTVTGAEAELLRLFRKIDPQRHTQFNALIRDLIAFSGMQ